MEKNKSKKEKVAGIVYINHPPSFMKPVKVKHLLEQYGNVTNIYLAPEPDSMRQHRKKAGGSSKIRYTEGWIEFEDKNDAKHVATLLNGSPVGGNRRNFHCEDLWTMKYLSGFKWSHLTEKTAYEKRVKNSRLRAEISHAKRENENYLENLAKQKAIDKKASKPATEGETKPKKTFEKRNFKQVSSSSDIKKMKKQKIDSKGDDWLAEVF